MLLLPLPTPQLGFLSLLFLKGTDKLVQSRGTPKDVRGLAPLVSCFCFFPLWLKLMSVCTDEKQVTGIQSSFTLWSWRGGKYPTLQREVNLEAAGDSCSSESRNYVCKVKLTSNPQLLTLWKLYAPAEYKSHEGRQLIMLKIKEKYCHFLPHLHT